MSMAIRDSLYCAPCSENGIDAMSSTFVGGEPMCTGCANATRLNGGTRNLVTGKFKCNRGCGREPHRGQCAGSGSIDVQPLAAKPTPKYPQVFPTSTDIEVIDINIIPRAQLPKRYAGRCGIILKQLEELLVSDPNKALKIKNSQRSQCASTDRHLKFAAKKIGCELKSVRVDMYLYCYLTRKERS